MNRSVQYQPQSAFIRPKSVELRQHTPASGAGPYVGGSGGGEFIEWNIRGSDFLNPAATRLCCDYTAKPATQTTTATATYNIFAAMGGLASSIRQIEVLCGSDLLERVSDMGRQHVVLSNLSCNYQQLGMNASCFDLYEDNAQSDANSSDSGGRPNGKKLNSGAAAVNPVGQTFSCCIPLSLSSVFGGNSPYIPLCFLDQPLTLRVYLTNNVQESYVGYAADRTGTVGPPAGSTFELSNVSLQCQHISYDAPEYDKIRAEVAAKGVVLWDVVQYRSSTATCSYSSTDYCLLGDTSFRDVKQIYVNRWYPSLGPSSVSMGCSPGNGIRSQNISIDGELVLGVDLGQGGDALGSSAEFAISAIASAGRDAADINDINTCLQPQTPLTQTGAAITQGRSWGFTPLNDVQIRPGAYVATVGVPTNAPTALAATLAPLGNDNKSIDPYFYCSGYNLVETDDPTRHRRGRDLTGRQVIVESHQTNSITATECVQQAIMVIGAKMILDYNNKTLRCERA